MWAPSSTVTPLASLAPLATCTWSPIRQSCSTIAPVLTITSSPSVASAFTTADARIVAPLPDSRRRRNDGRGCTRRDDLKPVRKRETV